MDMALTLVTARLAIHTLSCKSFMLWSWLFLRHRFFFVLLTMLPFSFSYINMTPILALGTRFNIMPTYTIAESTMSFRKTLGIGMKSGSRTNTTLHPSDEICHGT